MPSTESAEALSGRRQIGVRIPRWLRRCIELDRSVTVSKRAELLLEDWANANAELLADLMKCRFDNNGRIPAGSSVQVPQVQAYDALDALFRPEDQRLIQVNFRISTSNAWALEAGLGRGGAGTLTKSLLRGWVVENATQLETAARSEVASITDTISYLDQLVMSSRPQ